MIRQARQTIQFAIRADHGPEPVKGTLREQEDPFIGLHREMNRMFEDFARGFDLAPWSGWAREDFRPRTDIRESDDEVIVTAEMPGLEEKDFELTLTEDLLTLKGEKRHEHEEREKGEAHRVERADAAARRSTAARAARRASSRRRSGGIRPRRWPRSCG